MDGYFESKFTRDELVTRSGMMASWITKHVNECNDYTVDDVYRRLGEIVGIIRSNKNEF